MTTDTIRWIEINWKVLNTINDNRSIIGSTEASISFSFPFFANSVCTPTWDFCICEDTTDTLLHSRSSNLLFCVLTDTTSVPQTLPHMAF